MGEDYAPLRDFQDLVARVDKLGVDFQRYAKSQEGLVGRINKLDDDFERNAKSQVVSLDRRLDKAEHELNKLNVSQRGSASGMDEKKTLALINAATASLPALQVQITALRKQVDNLSKNAKQ